MDLDEVVTGQRITTSKVYSDIMAEAQDTIPMNESTDNSAIQTAPDSPEVAAADPDIVVDQPKEAAPLQASRELEAVDSADPEDDGDADEDAITQQLNLDEVRKSCFEHEGKAAWLMLAFTATVSISIFVYLVHCILSVLSLWK